MLLFMAVIIAAIVVSYRNDTIWCYGLTAFAVFAIFSYPLHVKQFQIMFSVLLAACASSGQSTTLTYKLIMMAFLIVLSVILIGKMPEIKQYKQAESAWKKTERWHIMEHYDYVVEDGDTLLPYMKHDYRFLFAYGQSLNKTGNYEKSDSVLQLGTRISSDPMFWNVMGNNSLALGRYREAEERYKHAFYMVPNRLYPLYLLAKLYHAEGDTVRFLDMADKIETFIPKIESANTELLRSEIREIKAGYIEKNIKKDE
jgi:tetratricopeptide (TPR) repeat protein